LSARPFLTAAPSPRISTRSLHDALPIYWRFAELDKLQALQLWQSPLDRMFGMATLGLDTAGAGALSPPLRLHYLPEADARALFEDRKSTRLNSSHVKISYAVFCLKKKN